MIQKMKKSKGFTLIEMLVVIAIIAVLVSIIVPVVGNSTAKAKAAADAANLRSMASSLAIDYMNDGTIGGTYTTPVCKTNKDWTLEAHVLNNNEIVAYYVNGSSYYSVNDFAKVADGSNTGTVTATGTAGTKVFPTS